MFSIRRAGRADFPVLDELVREFYSVDGHAYDETRISCAFGPLLDGDEFGQVWLFDTGYAVVTWGYSIESGGRDALLDEFYVRNRGQGIGGLAVEAVHGKCVERGVTRMFLETERANGRAREFYTRHGFVIEDSVWLSRSAGASPSGSPA